MTVPRLGARRCALLLLTALVALSCTSGTSAATSTTPTPTGPGLLLPGLHCIGYSEQNSDYENFYAIPGQLCGLSNPAGLPGSHQSAQADSDA